MRGRKKHIWVSVSNDLYDDGKCRYLSYSKSGLHFLTFYRSLRTAQAKRDLKDLGLDEFAKKKCYLLKDIKPNRKTGLIPDSIQDGLIFSTYKTLIGNTGGTSRLAQLEHWCGGQDFDGLILLDECHKAKNVALNEKGEPTDNNGCTKSAAAVVNLQNALPRARVVYCSATAVSEPFSLGFMSRLGLWGYGTEHPGGFNQFLGSIKDLGCGT